MHVAKSSVRLIMCEYETVLYWRRTLGGADGKRGMNLLIHSDGRCISLGGKASVDVHAGVCC